MSKDVIMLSTADWDNPYWTNKQHVACSLAERGYRIFYVDSMGIRRPTIRKRDRGRILRRLLKAFKGLQNARDGVWILSPLLVPFHGISVIDKLNTFLMRLWVNFHKKRLGFISPIVWTYSPISLDIAEGVENSMLIYHNVDDISAIPGMPAKTIRDKEKRLLRRADLVFTTSRALQEYCSKLNTNTYYFPNVADYDHFAQAQKPDIVPSMLESIPHPRIGYIGAISEYKFDVELVGKAAELRPEWHWILIGDIGEGQPGTDISGLTAPNIHLLGPKPYKELPHYLKEFDAAIIPAPQNEYTRAMFPMKFFMYLASGRPVVTTTMPSLQEFSKAFTMTDNIPEAFTSAIADALTEGLNSHKTSAGIELAQKYTWAWRTERMLELVRAIETLP